MKQSELRKLIREEIENEQAVQNFESAVYDAMDEYAKSAGNVSRVTDLPKEQRRHIYAQISGMLDKISTMVNRMSKA